jgi:hypothetical protein
MHRLNRTPLLISLGVHVPSLSLIRFVVTQSEPWQDAPNSYHQFLQRP